MGGSSGGGPTVIQPVVVNEIQDVLEMKKREKSKFFPNIVSYEEPRKPMKQRVQSTKNLA